MAGSKKARIRSLERQLGTTGTDPFIPARQIHPLTPSPATVPAKKPPHRYTQRLLWTFAILFSGPAISAFGGYIRQTTHQMAVSWLLIAVGALLCLLGIFLLNRLFRSPTDDRD
jgi:hypothetical protein